MNMKYLTAALGFLAAGVISAAEITAFYPMGKMGIFFSEETPEFRLKLKDTAPSASGTITVKNSAGKIINTVKLNLKTGKLHTVKLAKPGKNGFFELEAKFGGASAIASMVITPKMQKLDPFFLIHPFHWSNPDSFAAVKRLGFGGLKVNASGLKPYKENFDPAKMREEIRQSNYLTRIEKFMDENPDLHYVGAFSLDAYWTHEQNVPSNIIKRRDAGYYCFPKEYYDCFIIKIEEVHRIAKGRIKCWVLSQEVDSAIHDPKRISHGGPVELAHHLVGAKLAYNTLKRLDPECCVVLMSSSGRDYHTNKPPFLLTRFLLTHLDGKFDAIGLDAYNGNYSLRGGRTQIEPPENGLRQHLLDARTLCREFGKDGTITVEERQKFVPEAAKKTPINGAIMKQIAAIESRDLIIIKSVTGIPHYSYLDYAYQTDQTLWRKVSDDKKSWLRTPFPAAISVATTIRTLSFAKPVRRPEIKLPYLVYAYLFQKDGKIILPVWHADTKGGTVQFEVNLPSAATLRDIDGNDTALPAGKTVLKLTNTPQFVFLSAKAAAVRKMMESGKFINMQKIKGNVRPASNGKASLFLVNQLNSAQTVKAAGQTVQLKASEKKIVTIPMPKSKTLPVTVGKETLQLPVNHDIIKVKQSGTKIKLAAPGDVYPRSASIPENNFLLFDGKDIEADIRLSWNSKALILDAKVRDRKHMNSYRGADLWRGDSLQLGIVPENQTWDPEMVGKTSIPFNISAALTDHGVSIYDYIRKKSQTWPCTISRSGIYTSYHLEIPWSDINIGKPVKGKAFAMCFVFFDLNRSGVIKSDLCIALSEGLTGGQNPSKFKTFILE